jgi:hypothetical protein
MNKINELTLQTRALPFEWSRSDSAEAAQAILLCYDDGRFFCQTIFTQPLARHINWISGLRRDADVYVREISAIGVGLFHVRVAGHEKDVRAMGSEPGFFNAIRGIDGTLTADRRSRWYLDAAGAKAQWDAIVDVRRAAFYLASDVSLRQQRTRMSDVIVVGDRLLGLTDQRKLVMGKLTPDVLEEDRPLLEVETVDAVNRLGKIDLLAPVPNSDSVFLVTVRNRVYQFDLWGAMTGFEELPETVMRINSVEFNHTRSVLATDAGLFEVDTQEMPNMVRATGLPRQLVHTELQDGFTVARYIDDPVVLGEHPAMAIIAKTSSEKVCVC